MGRYGHYGSQYDYITHIALIASSRVSQITSFQPPLSLFFFRKGDAIEFTVLNLFHNG